MQPERAVYDEVARLAAAELELDHLPAPDEPLVEALELDSVRRVTLLVALEDHFRVILPDDELERVRTLGELGTLICRLIEVRA